MKSTILQTISRHFILILFLLFAVGPLILLISNAIKTPEEFRVSPFSLPSTFTLENVISAWTQGHYAIAFLNSGIIGVATVLIVCVFGGMCAYALAKMEFTGSGIIMVYLFLVMSIPMGLFLVPLFFVWQKLHLMNTLLGLIIIYSAVQLPFNIFVLRSYFIGIPKEISESAMVDGCSQWQILWKIILPLSIPAFSTVAVLVGLWTWNEFFFANAFIQTDALKTVSTRYLNFTDTFSNDWSLMSAAGLISILPAVVIFLLLQKKFIEGMTEGSIKG